MNRLMLAIAAAVAGLTILAIIAFVVAVIALALYSPDIPLPEFVDSTQPVRPNR